MKKKIRVAQLLEGFPFKLRKNVDIIIENNIITHIKSADNADNNLYEFYNFDSLLCTPGFIQPHIHLCQTLFRGLADDVELLDWLNKYIFPLEFAHNEKSIAISAKIGISELFRCGTTTIMDMGALNHEEIIIDEVEKSGLRAFLGKAMMDINDSYPKYKETKKESIEKSISLANYISKKNNTRLKYAFAPRFILSCSDELLIETYKLHNDIKGTLFHSHASENKNELQAVINRTGKRNIEIFYDMGLLGNTTCLAHCIWLNENEIDLLKDTDTKVLHCPSSNLKLGSGIANIPEYISRGITLSIAADGAPCNNNLNILTEMRLAALIQKIKSPTIISAKQIFEIATIGGAKTLHKENEIGSIEIGKKADLVFWDLNKIQNPLINDDLNSILSTIVYSSSNDNIDSVMIDGEFVIKNKVNLRYDEEEIIKEGKEELRNVIRRSGI